MTLSKNQKAALKRAGIAVAVCAFIPVLEVGIYTLKTGVSALDIVTSMTNPLIRSTNNILSSPMTNLGVGEVQMALGFGAMQIPQALRIAKSEDKSFGPLVGYGSVFFALSYYALSKIEPILRIPNALTSLTLNDVQAGAACMVIGAAFGALSWRIARKNEDVTLKKFLR